MTWRRDQFDAYFAAVLGGKPTSFAKYRSFLNRTDQLAGGLDELIEQRGVEGTRAWVKEQTEGPFNKFASDARSIVNSYLGFVLENAAEKLEIGSSSAPAVEAQQPAGTIFKIEKEMQAAIRADLEALEAGLVAVDEGIEVTTATGRIDILARDAGGCLTIIELKAGPCPTGAIEQALGYAQSLQDERGEPTRAILIASSFSLRQKAAAQRTLDFTLRVYSYSMSYDAA